MERDRPEGKFLDKDYLLTEALELYESMLCVDCHQPSWMSYDERNSSGEFELETVNCEGCRVRAADAKDKEPAPGEKSFLHNHLLDPPDLPVSTS